MPDRDDLLRCALAIYCAQPWWTPGDPHDMQVDEAVEMASKLLAAVDAECPKVKPPAIQEGDVVEGPDGTLLTYVGRGVDSGFLQHIWIDGLDDLLDQVPEVRALVEAAEDIRVAQHAGFAPRIGQMGRLFRALAPFRKEDA